VVYGTSQGDNKATELCRGEWIAHIDDDDFWTPNHIQDLLKFAKTGNYEMVYGDYVEVRYGKEKVVENGPSTWLIRKYVADIFKLDPNCYKKKWDRVSDIDVFLRMKSAEVKIGYLKKIVAYVLPRPGEETVGHEAYTKYDPFHGVC
jgi:glycosyltransferase involved in cell wall biosynthesis